LTFYAPNNLYPDNIEVIDNIDNDFTWDINGTDSQVAYRLYIRKVSDNTQIYDSTKTTSALGSHAVPSSTLTAGTLYKFQVWSYYDGTNYIASDWISFYCSGLPTVTISATPTSDQNFEFEALYSHPNNVYVKTYRFYLYSNSEVILDSDEIYPDDLVNDTSMPLPYEVTGMVSGTTYQIKCVVTTQEDYVFDSGLITFTVNYTYPLITPNLVITPLNSTASMNLNWWNLKQVLPTIEGDYEYLDGYSHTDTTDADFNVGTANYVDIGSNEVKMDTTLTGTWNDFIGDTWNDL
jgi:hypothetical protein